MKISFASPPKNLDEKMVYNILRDYKMLNAEVLIRDDNANVDDLIDVIMKDHRTYIRWYVMPIGVTQSLIRQSLRVQQNR